MALAALNPYDADVSLSLKDENLSASTATDGSLVLLWGGVRGTLGVLKGKFYFTVKLEKKITSGSWSTFSDGPLGEDWPGARHSARLGFSLRACKLPLLGDAEGSWAYGSSGVKLGGGVEQEFATAYECQDEIGCFIDRSDEGKVSVSFNKNGGELQEAFSAGPVEGALFPHVTLRGLAASVSFQGDEVAGYQCWQAALCKKGAYEASPTVDSSSPSVTMVIGLSGAGKTEWCQNQAQQHPEKQFVMLGIDLMLEQMHLHKASKEDKLSDQFAAVMKVSNEIIARTMQLAAARPRNYLLDHYTLAFKGARCKKLKNFPTPAFRRKAAVLVLDEAAYAEKSKAASKWGPPASSLENTMNMKVGFSIPGDDEGFDEISFIDQARPKVEKLVEKLRREGQQYFARKRKAAGSDGAAGAQQKNPGAAKKLKEAADKQTAKKPALQKPAGRGRGGGHQHPPFNSRAPRGGRGIPGRPQLAAHTRQGARPSFGPGVGPQYQGHQHIPGAMPRPRMGPQPYNPPVMPEQFSHPIAPGSGHPMHGSGGPALHHQGDAQFWPTQELLAVQPQTNPANVIRPGTAFFSPAAGVAAGNFARQEAAPVHEQHPGFPSQLSQHQSGSAGQMPGQGQQYSSVGAYHAGPQPGLAQSQHPAAVPQAARYPAPAQQQSGLPSIKVEEGANGYGGERGFARFGQQQQDLFDSQQAFGIQHQASSQVQAHPPGQQQWQRPQVQAMPSQGTAAGSIQQLYPSAGLSTAGHEPTAAAAAADPWGQPLSAFHQAQAEAKAARAARAEPAEAHKWPPGTGAVYREQQPQAARVAVKPDPELEGFWTGAQSFQHSQPAALTSAAQLQTVPGLQISAVDAWTTPHPDSAWSRAAGPRSEPALQPSLPSRSAARDSPWAASDSQQAAGKSLPGLLEVMEDGPRTAAAALPGWLTAVEARHEAGRPGGGISGAPTRKVAAQYGQAQMSAPLPEQAAAFSGWPAQSHPSYQAAPQAGSSFSPAAAGFNAAVQGHRPQPSQALRAAQPEVPWSGQPAQAQPTALYSGPRYEAQGLAEAREQQYREAPAAARVVSFADGASQQQYGFPVPSHHQVHHQQPYGLQYGEPSTGQQPGGPVRPPPGWQGRSF